MGATLKKECRHNRRRKTMFGFGTSLCPHECKCQCHQVPDMVIHLAPCCMPCEKCGENIAMDSYEIHLLDCHTPGEKNLDPDELLALMQQAGLFSDGSRNQSGEA